MRGRRGPRGWDAIVDRGMAVDFDWVTRFGARATSPPSVGPSSLRRAPNGDPDVVPRGHPRSSQRGGPKVP